MYPWLLILFASAGFVFCLDYLVRKKRWKDNSGAEKLSLLVNMFSVGPHAFFSMLGLLWGIVPLTPKTQFGMILYDVTLTLGEVYFAVALAAVMMSFVFRIKGKAKAGIWVNVIAFLFIAVVLAVNSLAGKVL